MITAPIAVTLTEEHLTRFTGYPVTLPDFAGPLDLLLYLIRRQEIDIYDIPIAGITAQFLDYLTLMEELDVEVASEFLVMAATLLEIKSRMLLPRPPALENEEVSEEELDPRAELVRQLLEYQKFKTAADDLKRRADDRRLLFARPDVVPSLPFLRPDPVLSGNNDGFSLWMALQEVLNRIDTHGQPIREVVRPKVTIRGQIMHIVKILREAAGGVPFTRLFIPEDEDAMFTRVDVIVTFLAMLELIRLHRIRIFQSQPFAEITLRLTPTAETSAA